MSELKEVLDDVDSQRIRVESALEACTDPLNVSEKCLAYRGQRQGVDLVDDNVQRHLVFEVDTLKNSQVLLKQTLFQVMEDLRLLSKSKFSIERDLADKEAAFDIDQQTSLLKVMGPDRKRGAQTKKYAVEKKSHPLLTPATWQEISEKNLESANFQLKDAIALQSTVDGVLAHIASHLKSQKDLTDRAFERRIKEVKEAKKLLEEQLSETVVKIGEMEEAMLSLERAIGAKQGPLATCQLKIQQRKQRPNNELVLDDVDLQLQNEAQTLIDSINRLEEQLARSRNCYASLQKSRLELESQIGVKANSIYIDEVKCKTLREGVNIQAY